MRVVLLGLTGLASDVLDVLLADPRVELAAVFTKKHPTPFPYYDIPQLHEACAARGVCCNTNLLVSSGQGFEKLSACAPDLILVAGFHQLLRRNVIELPRLGIVNTHTSLLPSYRGAVPEQAALLNGDRETGVTFHYLTEELDTGKILLQARYRIADRETLSTLRRTLAGLAASYVPKLLDLFAGGVPPLGNPQAGTVSQAAKQYTAPVALQHSWELSRLDRMVRALNPYPGTTIEVGGMHRNVIGCSFLRGQGPHPLSADQVDIAGEGGVLRLDLAPAPADSAPIPRGIRTRPAANSASSAEELVG